MEDIMWNYGIEISQMEYLFVIKIFRASEMLHEIRQRNIVDAFNDTLSFNWQLVEKTLEKTSGKDWIIKVNPKVVADTYHVFGDELAKSINVLLEGYYNNITTIMDNVYEAYNNDISNNVMKCFDVDIEKPLPPKYIGIPKPPALEDKSHRLLYKITKKAMPKMEERKRNKLKARYQIDYDNWKRNMNQIDISNETLKTDYEHTYCEWERESNLCIERLNIHLEGSADSVILWTKKLLERKNYRVPIEKSINVEFNKKSNILIIDQEMPVADKILNIKGIKYLNKKVKLNIQSEKEKEKIYEQVLFQIVFSAIYDIYRHDDFKHIESVVYNGWVSFIDNATGRDSKACILSIQTFRDAFLEIDFNKVDPKKCFIALKGIGSHRLGEMIPIAPILRISKEDKRFIESRSVISRIEEGVNIAAMDWEEFEHLIREIFEKEFQKSGGEVRVTQASRDGGVDAIAYDPDPIRGGKIVIQAKRYTNIVGVSAVRDLYGTIMNEGANKGILVTTSYYGSDAYEFAKGKPITLLDGGNLLNLLNKHGHRARINIEEAKISLKEEKE